MKHLLTVAASAVLAGAYILMPTPAGQDGPALDTASFETTPARAPAPSPAAPPTTRPSATATAEGAERFAAEEPDPEDVPDEALLAYQRAAQILDEVSPRCELPWTLLAAIGGVESDHGRHPGSSNETGAVPQSAVRVSTARGESPIAADGPMQISPSLWSVVGVDADGDGERSVRDLDDAALGAGVFLCAGWEGLDDPETMAEAVDGYRDSDAFVDLVLTFERAYRSVELLSPDQVMPPTPPVLSEAPVAQAELNVGQGTPAAEKRAVKDSEKAVAGAQKSGKQLDSATRDRTGDRAPLDKAGKSKKDSDKAAGKKSGKDGKKTRSAKPSKPAKPSSPAKPSGPNAPGTPSGPDTGDKPTPSGPGTPASETPGTPGGQGPGDPGSGDPGSDAPKPDADKPSPEPTPGCQQPKPTPPGQTPGAAPGSTPDADPSTSTAPSGTPNGESGRTPEESGSPSADQPGGGPSPDCSTP